MTLKLRLKTSTTVAAMAVSLVAGAVSYAPAASAAGAYPTCNTWKGVAKFVNGDTWGTYVPAYTTGTSLTLRCNLVRNQTDKSPAVAELQVTLNGCHGAGLVVDGYYGPKTQGAVADVQKKLGLSVDGVYGPNTRAAMKWKFTLGAGTKKCWKL